jgi:hypothetical protein
MTGPRIEEENAFQDRGSSSDREHAGGGVRGHSQGRDDRLRGRSSRWGWRRWRLRRSCCGIRRSSAQKRWRHREHGFSIGARRRRSKSSALDVQHRMGDPDGAPSDHPFAFDDLNRISNPRRRTTQPHGPRRRPLLTLKLHGLEAGPTVPPRRIGVGSESHAEHDQAQA